MTRKPTPEEMDALAILARRGRIIAVLVPEGVPDEEVKRLSQEMSARLDVLVAKRNRGLA